MNWHSFKHIIMLCTYTTSLASVTNHTIAIPTLRRTDGENSPIIYILGLF